MSMGIPLTIKIGGWKEGSDTASAEYVQDCVLDPEEGPHLMWPLVANLVEFLE